MPPNNELFSLSQDIDAATRYAMRMVGDAPRGMQSATLYAIRYNIGPEAIDLLKERHAPGVSNTSAAAAWGQYIRWLFVPGKIYMFTSGLRRGSDGEHFLVAENKSFANRGNRQADEAIGRSLAVSFLKVDQTSADGIILKPSSSDETNHLPLMMKTVAELAQASGVWYPTPANATTRYVEELHEQRALRHDIMVWDAERIHGDSASWVFRAWNPREVEEAYLEENWLGQETSASRSFDRRTAQCAMAID